jgi:anti-anti-sigma regulatory factor
MPFTITSTPGRQILRLEGAVTIRDAENLAATLREGLGDANPVAVDTQGLEDIDTCILQLLYSLRNAVPALSFDDPSDVFIGAVDRCGLRRELLSVREVL